MDLPEEFANKEQELIVGAVEKLSVLSNVNESLQAAHEVQSDNTGNIPVSRQCYIVDINDKEFAENVLPLHDENSKPIVIYHDFNKTNTTDLAKDHERLISMYMERGEEVQSTREYIKCKFCKFTTTKRHLLMRHMHSHADLRLYKCNICERGFKTPAILTNHINMHNRVKSYICKHCQAPFTTSGVMERHIKYRHTNYRPHKCKECDYASVELDKLKRHIRCHTGERPYQCPHCTYAALDNFNLKRHLLVHTGEKPYKCQQCDKTFTQLGSLKAHTVLHNKSATHKFTCDLCPVKFNRQDSLKKHIQKNHTSDKPLHCKICMQMLPDKYSLTLHYKTHKEEKCYKCSHCSYTTQTKYNLNSHMRVHTSFKTFVCDHCHRCFGNKYKIRKHLKTHHNPDNNNKTHACQLCNRVYLRLGNLIRHINVHTNESKISKQTKPINTIKEESNIKVVKE